MKPKAHTIQWIAPHLSESEVKAIYEMVLNDVIGADIVTPETAMKLGRMGKLELFTRGMTQDALRERQRERAAILFGMDNK